jgi:hypothetical protein
MHGLSRGCMVPPVCRCNNGDALQRFRDIQACHTPVSLFLGEAVINDSRGKPAGGVMG